MHIERCPNLLKVHFQHAHIQTLQYESDGFLTVVDQQGQPINKFKTVACIAYNAQYGTPISNDGQLVLIGSWERGLFCYSIKEQKLVWKAGPGRVRGILVSDDSLLIEMEGRGIYRRNLYSGKLIEIIKLPAIETFKQLNATELFAGPGRGVYWLFHLPSMQPTKQVKARDLNVNNCLSYVIEDVYYRDQVLLVKGFEQYKDRNYEDKATTNFERLIPL
ncbi:hypothetical protein GCM10027347_61750 [Larkinella harenae]